MTFQQHIPNFAFDPRDEPPPVYEFATTEELLGLEVVRRYAIPITRRGETLEFSGFAIADAGVQSRHLMATNGDGAAWWVAGTIRGEGEIHLPDWCAGAPGSIDIS